MDKPFFDASKYDTKNIEKRKKKSRGHIWIPNINFGSYDKDEIDSRYGDGVAEMMENFDRSIVDKWWCS